MLNSSQIKNWEISVQKFLHVLIFTPPPLQVLKGESSMPSLKQRRDKATNTHTGDSQPCFQHLLSKAPRVLCLKKTCGWNLTLLLALCRLGPSSCYCDCHYCHVSNGGTANVSLPRGTAGFPPSSSDWGAIYLSASSSTPSLPNPSFHQGPWAPMETTRSPIAPRSIKKMTVRGTQRAQRQVSALNNCIHLLTGLKTDRH